MIESIRKDNLKQLHSLQKLAVSFGSFKIPTFLSKLAENAVSLDHFSLKSLINSWDIEYMVKLTKLNVIEFKSIHGLTDDHIIKLAKKLLHLRTVRLTGRSGKKITTGDLRTMLQDTKTLSHLTLDWPYTSNNPLIDFDYYRFMLNTAKDRPEKMKLTLQLTSPGTILQVGKLMSANRNWPWIEVKLF